MKRILNMQNPPLKVSNKELAGLLSEITYFIWFLGKPSFEGLHYIKRKPFSTKEETFR
jgi:hypothetical protein